MLETMMRATEFSLSDRGRNLTNNWHAVATVAFRPVFLHWRLDDLHENHAGESNIPQIYMSYSVALVADAREIL